MIRVGIVGTNTSHAAVFAELLNGRDGSPPSVEGARVAGVWSSGEEGLSGLHSDAATLAHRYGIGTVVNSPADLTGQVDLALILDDRDGGALHPDLAKVFLAEGIATYIDKPMTLKVSDAVELFDYAEQHGAPLMSCSALRYAAELDVLQSAGRINTLVSVGPGDWYNYGIHTVEAALTVCGPGALRVQRIARPERDLTVIDHESGSQVMVGTLRGTSTPFHLVGYGARQMAQTEVSDYQGFYTGTMSAAVRMARAGTSPIARQATLDVLAVLAAGERSAETGGPVALAEILGSVQ